MIKRNDAIDGLRGWLSIVVCLFHGFLIPDGHKEYPIFFMSIFKTASIWKKMLLQIVNGELAVNIFFIMSGAVLFRSLLSLGQKRGHFGLVFDFTVRRIFRVYPGLIFALSIFCTAYWSLHAIFPDIFQVYFNRWQFVENMLLVKIAMYGVTWTLQVELAAIPFLVLGYWAWRSSADAGLAVLLAVALLMRDPTSIPLGFANLQQVIFLFILGMLAVGPVGEAVTRGLKDRAALMMIALMILAVSAVDYRLGSVRVFQGLISAIIIAALLHGRLPWIGRALTAPLSLFLGRISYAFYVINPMFLELNRVTIEKAFGWRDTDFGPQLLVGLSATLFSIPICILCYHYIELPGIKAGKIIYPALRRRIEHWIGQEHVKAAVSGEAA